MNKYMRVALILALVLVMSFTTLANFKQGATLPSGLATAWASLSPLVSGNFTTGPNVGIWKSIQGKAVYKGTDLIIRLVYNENKLICVQTEFGVGMNDFMTYDWYAYGEFHGKMFAAMTGLDEVKFTDTLNVCMDEVYAKIMGQYKGEVYYQMANGLLTGVRLKRGAGGILNIYYYMNEATLNADGSARTDLLFFLMK